MSAGSTSVADGTRLLSRAAGSTAGARRRLAPEVRKQEILDCARRLFAERPRDEVTTADIAAATGVTRALVHHYFGSRDDLFLAVIEQWVEAAREVPLGDRSLPVRKRVAAFTDAWLALVEEYRLAWLATVAAEGTGSPQVDAALAAVRDEFPLRLLRHFDDVVADTPLARAAMPCQTGINRVAALQYLSGALTRSQAAIVITDGLHVLLTRTIPALERDAARARTEVPPPRAAPLFDRV